MLTWIYVSLALYFTGLFLPSLFLIPAMGVMGYLGSRDAEPTPRPMHARAKRAHRNLLETLPVFLVLAVLGFVIPDVDMAMAVMGAQIYVISRIIYLPTYLFAIPVLRSTVWTVAFVGLAMMVYAL